MRLHHVSLQAFGPYPTRQDVDFDVLAGSGLFLLEGPTGAGKSTVLDAVTYGLYGSTGAEPGAKDRWRCGFADPATSPEVRVEWSARGRRLRITRTPEHRRPRRRGDGTTLAPSTVHLEERVDGAWATVSTNAAETGDLVHDLLGLTRAQFTQVVLLPQGDFARFLRADDDTRRALLTTLFGTHLYDRVTAELDRRRSAAERDRRAARLHIADALSAAGSAAGLDAVARMSLTELPEPDLERELSRLEADLRAGDQRAQVAADLAQTRLTAAHEARVRAQRTAEVSDRARRARERLSELEREQADHRARGRELAAARRAVGVAALLPGLDRARDDAADAGRALADADPDRVEPTAGVVEDLGAQARTLEREAAALDALVALEAGTEVRDGALAAARRALEAAEAELAAAERAATELPALVRRLEVEHDRCVRLGEQHERLAAELADLDLRLAAASEAQDLLPVIASRHAAWAAARELADAAQQEHARLVTARVRGMAGELASALRPGSGCPVCGSPTHPDPATTEDQAVTAPVVEAAERARDRDVAASATAERLLQETTRQHAALAARSEDTGPELWRTRRETASDATDAARRALDALPGHRERLSDARREAEHATARLSQAGVERAVRAAAATECARQRDEASARLTDARAGHPTVDARRGALLTRARLLHGRAELVRAAVAAEAAYARARATVASVALDAGFADLAEASAAARSEADLTRLAAQVEHTEREHAACRATLSDPEVAALAERDDEAVQHALVAAHHDHDAALAEHTAATATHAQAARAAAAWAECLADLRRARRAAQRVERETAVVVRLAALAKGVDGHRRVALTTFALRHWFGQVVSAANVRLAAMSDGRYELERSDESESRTRRAGLTLRVLDRYTGERRSTSSLSGGETFFASLALALGLAEVVTAEAGGISLDTLFIDEGFGSLDDATLDQVMDVVDELRDRGRVVGIVSHVPELKDRIPERLEVRRRPDGSSVLRVVA